MYRRLKNLLGVSLIIFAILLSQIPMPEVRADGDDIDTEQTSQDAEAVQQDADGATPAANSMDVTVTLVYGISGESNKILTLPAGSMIPESEIKITLSDNSESTLENGRTYTLKNGKTYTFYGWYTQPDQNGSAWNFNSTVSEDKTLYAAWYSSETYVITYHADKADAKEDKEQIVSANAGKTIPKPDHTPVRKGWVFDKWTYKDGTEVDFSIVVTENLDIYASWIEKNYNVTFDMNGGNYIPNSGTEQSRIVLTVPADSTIDPNSYPSDTNGAFSYGTYKTDSNWYTDQTCTKVFDLSKTINKDMTLYKRWSYRNDEGFTLSADGTVLYLFDGTQESVVIPTMVMTIVTDAFPDMKNIKQITLPPRIKDIQINAFSGMNAASFVTRDIYIYSSSDGTYDSKVNGEELAKTYEHFIYKPTTADTDNPTSAKVTKITCSLADIDRGTDSDGTPLYPKVTLPYDLEDGNYYLTLAEDETQVHIADLLKKAGYNTDSNYVYYMNIELKKVGAADSYKVAWKNGTMTITMPLPKSWYGRDTSKIKMFAVSQDYSTLDSVTTKDFNNNIFSFEPPHFSEYALVYTGTINVNPSKPDNNGGNSGNNGGSGNSGSSGNGGSSGGGTSTNGGGTSGNGATGVTTPDITQISTQPTGGDTVQPAGTSTAETTPSETNATGTGHVKDSTPKTGDPLEYRTLMVCGLFSMGVLMILIGNKKKTSAFSRYRRG